MHEFGFWVKDLHLEQITCLYYKSISFLHATNIAFVAVFTAGKRSMGFLLAASFKSDINDLGS